MSNLAPRYEHTDDINWDIQLGVPVLSEQCHKVREAIRLAYANRGNVGATVSKDFIRLDSNTWLSLKVHKANIYMFLAFLSDEAVKRYYKFSNDSYKRINQDAKDIETEKQLHYNRCCWFIFDLITQQRNIGSKVRSEWVMP